MLEFGLFAGRLGVYNIAICLYPNTELPSDLKGMTVIEMEPASSSASNAEGEGKTASESAEDRIKRWRDGLLPTVDAIPTLRCIRGHCCSWNLVHSREQSVPPSLDSVFSTLTGCLALAFSIRR